MVPSSALFTRWFHHYGLLVGWAVGMLYGTVEAYQVVNPITGNHFGGSLGLIPGMERMGYIAVTAFLINVVLAARHSPGNGSTHALPPPLMGAGAHL